ncbi:MAG: ABC transporter substrate-binding protein [Microbacteriaceae bacterium]
MKKKTLVGVAALAALALALAGCSGTSSSSSTSAAVAATPCSSTSEGTDITAAATDYSGPDVLKITQLPFETLWATGNNGGAFNAAYFSTVYDSLYLIDGSCQPYGDVAMNTEVSDDGLTYTFDVRSGVVFSDGTELDAQGVVDNLTYLASSAALQTSIVYQNVADFTAVDSDTVQIDLTTADPVFLYNLGFGNSYLTSPEVLDADDDYASYTALTEPVGSGPYLFDQSQSTVGQDGTSLDVFTKNESYWNTDAYPWSEVDITANYDFTGQSATNGLATGDYNFASVYYASTQNSTDPDAQFVSFPGGAGGLNLVDAFGTLTDKAGDDALEDVRVRQAIAEAINRPQLLEQAQDPTQGGDPNVYLTNSVFYDDTTDHSGYAAANEITYDPDHAKELLAEAGYPDGFTLDMPANPDGLFDISSFVQDLAVIGITVNEVDMAQLDYTNQVFAGQWPIYSDNFEIYSNPLETVQQYFTTGAKQNPIDRSAEDSELKSLVDTALASTSDDVDANIEALNDYVASQYWFIPTVVSPSYYETTSGLTVVPIIGYYIPNIQQFLPNAQ